MDLVCKRPYKTTAGQTAGVRRLQADEPGGGNVPRPLARAFSVIARHLAEGVGSVPANSPGSGGGR
eukprot:9913349-Lingulodinium_polyedra.AAC.1